MKKLLKWLLLTLFPKTVESIIQERKLDFLISLELKRSCVNPDTGESFEITGCDVKPDDIPWERTLPKNVS